jgi:hypothetical protein
MTLVNDYDIRIRWDNLPTGDRRCIGEAVDRSMEAVICTEQVFLPAQTAVDYRAQHGTPADTIVEETVRGSIQDQLKHQSLRPPASPEG